VVCDGLKSPPEVAGNAWPQAIVQTGALHHADRSRAAGDAGLAGYGLMEWLPEVAEGDFRVSVSAPFIGHRAAGHFIAVESPRCIRSFRSWHVRTRPSSRSRAVTG
jgi:hypothetical protein